MGNGWKTHRSRIALAAFAVALCLLLVYSYSLPPTRINVSTVPFAVSSPLDPASDKAFRAAYASHDYQTVLALLQPLADQGNPEAQRLIGSMYEVEATDWYKKAAARGDARARYDLGEMYYKGLGVQKDLIQAYVWFSLAMAAGSPGAEAERDSLAENMPEAWLTEAKLRAEEQRQPGTVFHPHIGPWTIFPRASSILSWVLGVVFIIKGAFEFFKASRRNQGASERRAIGVRAFFYTVAGVFLFLFPLACHFGFGCL